MTPNFDRFGIVQPTTPAAQRQLQRMAKTGEAVRLFHGIYCEPTMQDNFLTRCAAAMAWRPKAVLFGSSAAHLWWGAPPPSTISLAGLDVASTRVPAWVTITRRTIPPDHIWQIQGLRCASAPLAAAILAGEDSGAAIDAALRARVTTLSEIMAAPTQGWPHRDRRASVLRASREAPWSVLERDCHRLLRQHKIFDWVANLRVVVAGRTYFLDVAFRRAKVVAELDGWEFHSSREAFEADRERQNHLVAAGWRVLRFTQRQLDQDPAGCMEVLRKVLRDSSF